MRHSISLALAATVVLAAFTGISPAADYKSTVEEHCLRMLSPEESLDFGYIHPTLDAAGAVDGNRHENWGFYTEKRHPKAWWEVDLEKDVSVGRVDVYNSRNGPQRAHRLQILFSSDYENWEMVYDNKGKKFYGGKKGEKPLEVRFDGKRTRWVRIRIPRRDYLHLSEVEVYAKGDDKTNIARGKYATQSSTSHRSTVSYKGPLTDGARPRPPLPPGCKTLSGDPRMKYAKYVTAKEIQNVLDVADKTVHYVAKSANVSSQKRRLDVMKRRWEAKQVPHDKYVDFYGAGPTALFGEVISFSRAKPDFVAAAGESSGLYISLDAGDTWKYAGLKDERVTALTFALFPPHTGDSLLVGTFADSEFETLRLGKPNVRVAKGKNGAVYSPKVTDAGKVGIGRPYLSVPDFGVTNVSHGTYFTFYNIATTRGVYHRWPHGREFLQKRLNMPSDTLKIAFGHGRLTRIRNKRTGEKQDYQMGYTASFSSPGASQLFRVPNRIVPPWVPVNDGSILQGAPRGAYISSGLTCITPDTGDDKALLFCNVNGIFKSTDDGKTFRLVCKSQVQ